MADTTADPRELVEKVTSTPSPTEAAAQGRVYPRLTISELNQKDWDEISDRLADQRYDERGPVTKALDLLSASREAIWRAALPAARRVSERNRRRGEVGAFGVGKVDGADLLGEMGMEPGVLRGLVGFGLDVVFDPLTYAGPGALIKAKSAVGSAYTFVKGARRATNAAAKQFAKGGAEAVTNTVARDVLASSFKVSRTRGVGSLEALDAARKAKAAKLGSELAGIADEAVKASTAAQIERLSAGVTTKERAAFARSRILGKPVTSGGDDALQVGKFVSKGGGGIAGYLNDELAPILTAAGKEVPRSEAFAARAAQRRVAARRFLDQYGQGAPSGGRLVTSAGQGARLVSRPGELIPSLAIGNAGSQIAHIPFTDIGLYVPAFTESGSLAVGQRAIATAKGGNSALSASMLAAKAALGAHAADIDILRGLQDQEDVFRNEPLYADLLAKNREAQDAVVKAGRERIAKLRAAMADLDTSKAEPEDMLYLHGMYQSAASAANLAEGSLRFRAEAKGFSTPFSGVMAADADKGKEFKEIFDPSRYREMRATKILSEEAVIAKDENVRAASEALAKAKEDLRRAQSLPKKPPDGPVPAAASTASAASKASQLDFLDNILLQIDKMQSGAYDAATSSSPVSELFATSVGQMLYIEEWHSATKLARDVASGDPVAIQTLETLKARAASAPAGWQSKQVQAAEELLRRASQQAPATKSIAAPAVLALPPAAPAIDPKAVSKAAAELDQAREVARERYRQSLDDVNRRMLEMADDDVDRNVRMAEALTQQAVAMHQLADASSAGVFGLMSPEFKHIAEAARHRFGLSSDVLGYSPFAPMHMAVRSALGSDSSAAAGTLKAIDEHVSSAVDAADRSKRLYFGNRRGSLGQLSARVASAMREDNAADAALRLEPMVAELRQIHIDHPELPDEAYDQIAALVSAKVYSNIGVDPSKLHLTALDRVADPVKGIISTEAGPARFLTLLEDAASGGVLDTTKYPKIAESVSKMAEMATAELNRLRDIGLRDETLAGVLDGYFPNVINRQFAESARSASKSRSPGFLSGSAAEEAFQRPRSTIEYRFTDADGNMHSFYEFERHLAAISDTALAAQSPESRKYIAALRKTLDEFAAATKGMDESDALKLYGKPMDVFTINELRSKGAFDSLVGQGAVGEKMFEDNALVAITSRLSSQGAASAKKAMFGLLNDYGVPVWATKIDRISAHDGSMIATIGGKPAKIKTFFNGGTQYLDIGGVPHRQIRDLDPRAVAGRGAKWIGLDQNTARMYYPEPVAEFIERFTKTVSDDGTMANVIKAANVITGYWKSATLLHPSWMIFNVVGNSMLLAQAGILEPVGFARQTKTAMKLWRARQNPAELAKMTVNIGGVDVSAAQIMADATNLRVATGGVAKQWMYDAFPDGASPPRAIFATGTKDKLAFEGRQLRRAARNSLDVIASSLKRDPKARLAAAKPTLYNHGFMRKAMGWYAGINAYIDNTMRLASYLDLLDKGEAPTSAAAKVSEALFDYADATHAENTYFKLALPFYSWVRNNGAFQIRQFLKNPKWAAGVPTLQNAVEEAASGEDKIPEHMRPGWIRDQLGVQFGSGQGRSFFMAGSVLPQEPVYRALAPAGDFWGGTQSVLDYFGSQLNPALSAGLQVGLGREFFSGRTIGSDISKGEIQASDFLGNTFLPRAVREVSPFGPKQGAVVKAFDQGVAQGVSRALLGGRVQPGDDDRIRSLMVRQAREAEDNLRRAITVAEREDNPDLSLIARTKLLALYRTMRQTGLEDQVPKWARAQLDQAEQAQGSSSDASPRDRGLRPS